jgi:hypothetical protein
MENLGEADLGDHSSCEVQKQPGILDILERLEDIAEQMLPE